MSVHIIRPGHPLTPADTHNLSADHPAAREWAHNSSDAKPDVLLHCGDLTHVGGVASFKKAINMLRTLDAELKLVIPGNHDLELDKDYWATQCSLEKDPEDPDDHPAAIATMTGQAAKEAGVTFLSEGVHTFTLKNGATFNIYVSPYTPAFGDWAFAYQHHEDRFNSPSQVQEGVTSVAVNPIPDDVPIDIVMTHGPPSGILDWCPQGTVGCPNLLKALGRVRPKMHCFGHIHEGNEAEIIDWSKRVVSGNATGDTRSYKSNRIERNYPASNSEIIVAGQETLAVNAAIMNGDDQPTNKPWLVTLDLGQK